MNLVIVDLLPIYQVVIHPDDVTIVGKFIVETASLSMSTAEIRAHSIIQELAYAGIDHPEPMTFSLFPFAGNPLPLSIPSRG